MTILLGKVLAKPSAWFARMLKHKSVSEGSRHEVTTRRTILGHRVTFYRDGHREVQGVDSLDEQEIHDSEILRFAHASILTGEPSGSKLKCWVDASVNPVEVWLHGKQVTPEMIKSFCKKQTDESMRDLSLQDQIKKLEIPSWQR